MTIQALMLSLVAPLLATGLAPAKAALTAGVTDPGAAIGTINALVGAEITTLPTLENEAVAEGCKLALDAIAKFEADIAKIGAPAVAVAASPVVPAEAVTSGNGTA